MSDNPYAAPGSRVADIPADDVPVSRPWQIVMAVRLAALGYVLGLVAILVSWDYYSKFQSTGSLVINQLFTIAIMIWIYYKIYVGRNWARIVLLVFCVFGAGIMLSSMVRSLLLAAPTIAKVQMVVGLAINLSVLWLLFASRGRHWFSRRSRSVVA